jgi:hypothetical protein
MKEQLTCTQCAKNWRREKTRGRKPTVCPKCIKTNTLSLPKKKVVEVQEVITKRVKKRSVDVLPLKIQASSDNNASSDKEGLSVGKVYQYYHPTPPDAQELRESTKKGSSWRCKVCKYEFNIPLPISAPPTHRCSENSKSHPCERIDK